MRWFVVTAPSGRAWKIYAGSLDAARNYASALLGTGVTVQIAGESDAANLPDLTSQFQPNQGQQGFANDQTGPGGSMLGPTVRPPSGFGGQQSGQLGGTGGQGTGTGQPVKPIGNIAEQLGGVGGYLSDPNTNAFGSFVSEEGPAGMEGAFRRAFANRGVKFNNLAGRALLGQQSLYENPFKMLQAAGIDQTTDPDAFYNYARGGVNPYQAGKDAFGKIYGASRGEAPTAQVQEFAVPSSETGFNNSLSLARGALGRSGAYLSDNLLSGLKGEYAAQPAANTGNLLDFLYKRLGIQGVR